MTNEATVESSPALQVTYEMPRRPETPSQASRPSPVDDTFSEQIRLRNIPAQKVKPSSTRVASRYQAGTFYGTKNATGTTVMGIWTGTDSKRIFNIPKRVFQWVYSISLVLLIIIMLAFVAVTPIDVIVQTTASSSPAIKVFIVIIVCVVFLVASMIWYFVRVFHVRMSLNEIPSRSVYVPLQGDLPSDAVKMIDKNLRRCIGEIKPRAGPLYNDDVILNYPGMAPPEYIQRRNRKKLELKLLKDNEKSNDKIYGTSLPPKANYQDIIRSIGDKFMHGGGQVLTEVEIPSNYSMREIIIYLSRIYMDPENIEIKGSDIVMPNLKRTIELYEKFRFGPSFIEEQELWEFMVNFDRLARVCQSDYHDRIRKVRANPRSKVDETQDVIDQSMRGEAFVGRDVNTETNPYFYEEEDSGYNTDGGDNVNRDESSTLDSVINHNDRAKNFSTNNLTVDGWTQRDNLSFISGNSRASSRVQIKDRLALRRDSSSKKLSRSGLSHVQLSFQGDMDSVKKRNSGYITDSDEEEYGPVFTTEHQQTGDTLEQDDVENQEDEPEDEEEDEAEEEDPDEGEEELDIYDFRFRRRV